MTSSTESIKEKKVVEQAKLVIIDYVSKNNGTTSFVEIERELRLKGLVWGNPDGNNDIKCTIYWVFKEGYRDRISNVVAWVTENYLLDEAIHLLNEEQQIFMLPTSVMVYAVDGMMLNFPLVKSFTNYKEPHWQPAVLVYGKERFEALQKEKSGK
jgi:hypothetical protein